ncbi:MAG TPA: VIT1/CCC1 transporter family protein, partial [Planctomycetaceae bacterium]|nr:VIT1/CCC1 transporter family protein [Planctomycetaceae bacterium]
ETERTREIRETEELPDKEREEVATIFQSYGLEQETVSKVVTAISADQKRWVDFMMRFELGLEEPDPRRAATSAFVIAVSYIVGGLVPLSPYFFFSSARAALPVSVAVTLAALAVFGYVKGRFTVAKPLKSALQTVVVGGLAAAAAFGIARLIG